MEWVQQEIGRLLITLAFAAIGASAGTAVTLQNVQEDIAELKAKPSPSEDYRRLVESEIKSVTDRVTRIENKLER